MHKETRENERRNTRETRRTIVPSPKPVAAIRYRIFMKKISEKSFLLVLFFLLYFLLLEK